MKGVISCVIGFILVACGYHDAADTSFASREKLVQAPPVNIDTKAASYYYAKYRFTAAGKYDVDTAMKIGVGTSGAITSIEVKDMSPEQELTPTEWLDDIYYTPDSSKNVYEVFTLNHVSHHEPYRENGFMARASGQGDSYYGITKSYCAGGLFQICPEVNDVAEDDWKCCGEMYFVDNPQNLIISNRIKNDPRATVFTGTNLNLHDLDEQWWLEVTGECDHKLEFVGTPSEITVGEEFKIKVKIKDCTDRIALVFKGEAIVSRRFKDHGTFYYQQNMDNEKRHFGQGEVTLKRRVTNALYQAIQEQGYGNVVQYKVTTTVDGKKVEGMTPTIKINPKN